MKILSPEEIGERIKLVRGVAGLSQHELGTMAFGSENESTARQAVRRLESGEIGDTSFQKMASICVALAKRTQLPVRDILEFFEGHRDELTVQPVTRLHAIEGGKSRSRRAPKKKAASQDGIACFALRPSEQPILCESAA